MDDFQLPQVAAPSILDPVAQASAAPVMEIHPALGVIWDDYDPVLLPQGTHSNHLG